MATDNLERIISVEGKDPVALGKVIWANDVWVSGKLNIISYNGCKKLAKYFMIQVCKDPAPVFYWPEYPQSWKENRMQHIWSMFMEFASNKATYVFVEGEASILNTWDIMDVLVDGKKTKMYTEMNSVSAKYRSRMAYKRAFCRGVLDLLAMDDFYSDIDAEEFKAGAPVDIEKL